MDKLNKNFMANPKVWLLTHELCEHKFLTEEPPKGAKAQIEEGKRIAAGGDEKHATDGVDMLPTPYATALKEMAKVNELKVESNKALLGSALAWMLTRRAAILDFDLAPVTIDKRAMAMLRLFDAPSVDSDPRVASTSGRRIRAYWVPYRSGGSGYAPIKLGAGANYLFTNALSGCRLSVVPDAEHGLAAPLVMHIAGAEPGGGGGTHTAWRDTVQERVIANVMGKPSATAPPRLVRMYSSTVAAGASGYAGANGVMVVGIRDVKSGMWSFVAQWHDATGLHLQDVLTGAKL